MSELDQFGHPQSLADYLAVLRRRKWVVLQGLGLVPAVALIISLSQSATYETSAEVLLSQQDIGAQLTGIQNSSAFQDPARFAQTQADLASVPEVARRAVATASIAGVTAGSLLANSSVSPKTDSNLLVFKVRDRNPNVAVRLATAYAQAFTGYAKDVQTATIARARNQLLDRLAQLRAAGAQKSPLYGSLTDKEQQLRTLELLQGSNTVVRPATSASKVSPRPMRNALLGAIVGLILGLGGAFAWEALDRRVRSAEEIEHELAIPLLGRLSQPPGRLSRRFGVPVEIEPTGPTAEAFRRLRTSLEFANLEANARTILVTSAVKREGKSTMIANLAIALALSGRRVALVDADFRQPALTETFASTTTSPGVPEVIRGDLELDAALVQLHHGRHLGTRIATAPKNDGAAIKPLLEFLPAGVLRPRDPSQLIADPAWSEILAALQERADLVLVDGPPLLAFAEAMMLAATVDGLVVVSRVGIVPRPALRELARQLAGLPAAKLGLVLTGVDDTTGYGYESLRYPRAPDIHERLMERRPLHVQDAPSVRRAKGR